MIELTEAQRRSLQEGAGEPVRVLNPDTNEEYVLLKLQTCEELKNGTYDDSPWTDVEMDLLAAEVDAMLADDMAIEEPS